MFGTIRKLVTDKGFGFIKAEGDGGEYFFHHSGCVPEVNFNSLREGDRVQFAEDEPGPKGDRAKDVELA